MDGMTRAEPQGVLAPLNFLEPMAEKPYSHNYDPPPGVPVRNGQTIEYKVTVYDARSVNDALSLDREGFVLLRHQTAATDLYDETIITSVYYPECERLMQEATGARRVVAFDHIVRNAAKAAVKGSGVKMPAGRVHNDYTAWSAPQRVRDLMGEEAEELLKHRFAINNVWRPIVGPLLRSPLALCDAETLETDEPCRFRTALSRPHRRDLRNHLQSEPALVLFSQDAGGRGGADPLLRLSALGPGAFLGARCVRRSANAR